jgi:hypothetical protein
MGLSLLQKHLAIIVELSLLSEVLTGMHLVDPVEVGLLGNGGVQGYQTSNHLLYSSGLSPSVPPTVGVS